MAQTQRVDHALVQRGLARSRAVARELIDQAAVTMDGAVVRKPSQPVRPDQHLALSAAGDQWVGRAALKLLAALEAFTQIDPAGRRCIDVGASTGGFTQVLLRRGAAQVVAIDVGHGQLVPELAGDERVANHEGCSIRDVGPSDVGGPAPLVVCDLSFISVQLVLDRIAALLTPDGDLVLLVKPQFEVGRERLGRGGIVRSRHLRHEVVSAVISRAGELGLRPAGLLPSPIEGSNGNQEYLLWLRHDEPGKMTDVTSALEQIKEAGQRR